MLRAAFGASRRQWARVYRRRSEGLGLGHWANISRTLGPPNEQMKTAPKTRAAFVVYYNNQLEVQTFTDFMPVSASVRVLYTPFPTTVVSVVVGFLSTIVHFFVFTSWTT
jgi:hypothetical protein